MSIVAKKIMMGSGAVALPSDSEFNRTSFLSHFDGSNDGVNNQFTDASSNHTVTAAGNVTQGSFGPFARPDGEWGVSFDGVNDSYLTTPNSSDFAFGTGDFTVEFWFNPNHTDTGYILDSRGTGVNGFRLYRTGGSGGDLVFSTVGGGNSSTTVDVNTVNNNWYNFCVTRASGVIKFFLNGSQVGSDVNDTANITSTDLNIGAGYTGTLAYTGIISNLRIIKGTAVNPTGLPTSPATNVTNTVLLTCQSNRFVDNSSSGHTIEEYGGVAVTAFGPFLSSAVYDPAVNGASAHFEGGDDDYLSLSPQSDFAFGTGDFSISLWVYYHNVGSFDYLIDGRNSGQTSGTWTLSINYTNGSSGKLMLASGNSAILTSDTNLSKNQWYYITVSRSGTTSLMHFNGTQVAINSSDSTNYSTAPNTSYIGTRYSTQHSFDGIMGDVRVVKGTALSSYTPPTAPLTAITNTKLLLNMADGQAIDSTAQRNLSLENGTNISTAQAKFGNSSLYFDGTTDTATVIGSENVNFGTANFTVEGWIRPASFSGYKPNIISKWTNGSRGWAVRLVASGSGFVMRFTFSTDGSNDFNLDATTVLAFDTWQNFAFVQNSNTVTCYANGTANGTISCSTIFASTNPIILGDWDTNQADYNGYIDDIRVTTGVARYTSNFTAPTEPFPDKGQ